MRAVQDGTFAAVPQALLERPGRRRRAEVFGQVDFGGAAVGDDDRRAVFGGVLVHPEGVNRVAGPHVGGDVEHAGPGWRSSGEVLGAPDFSLVRGVHQRRRVGGVDARCRRDVHWRRIRRQFVIVDRRSRYVLGGGRRAAGLGLEGQRLPRCLDAVVVGHIERDRHHARGVEGQAAPVRAGLQRQRHDPLPGRVDDIPPVGQRQRAAPDHAPSVPP